MRIGTVRAQRLAVSEFGGFATGAEVRRQRDALLRQLQRDGAPLCDPSGEAYVLMQYNPPYTLPWLRRNEIAIELVTDAGVAEEAVAPPSAAAAPPEPQAAAAAEATAAAAQAEAAEAAEATADALVDDGQSAPSD